MTTQKSDGAELDAVTTHPGDAYAAGGSSGCSVPRIRWWSAVSGGFAVTGVEPLPEMAGPS
ncbi:hypothetical protein [Streptomyces sp. NPDC087298]|uniref:hypothetical protein n=1 Tax=Streptomyces sp. NPDC087298 TaxID=3365779 RepID=UPI00380FF106